MKKLMVAAAIVCVAVMSQASTVVWSSAAKTYDGSGNSAYMPQNTVAYLINAADLSRADFLKAYDKAGDSYQTTISGLAKMSTGLNKSSGKISQITVGPEPGVTGFTAESKTAYYAIFQAGKVFLSDEKVGGFDQNNDKFTFSFVSTNQNGGKNTYKAVEGLSSSSSGLGWYSAAAVPEPTSAMLMLLGFAGLALRRRRA